jgi:hypothetical protein
MIVFAFLMIATSVSMIQIKENQRKKKLTFNTCFNWTFVGLIIGFRSWWRVLFLLYYSLLIYPWSKL